MTEVQLCATVGATQTNKPSRQHLQGRHSLTQDILMCDFQNHVFAVGDGLQSLGARPRCSIDSEGWSLLQT